MTPIQRKIKDLATTREFLRQKNSAEEKETTLRIGSTRIIVELLELILPRDSHEAWTIVCYATKNPLLVEGGGRSMLQPTESTGLVSETPIDKCNARSAMNSAAVLAIVSDFRERLLDSPSRGQCRAAGRDEPRGFQIFRKKRNGA
jgi:hypothetical protein